MLRGTRVVDFLHRFAPTGLCPLLALTFVGLFGLLSFLRLLLLLLLLLLLAHLAGVAALLLLVLFLLLILLGLFLVVAFLTTLLLSGITEPLTSVFTSPHHHRYMSQTVDEDVFDALRKVIAGRIRHYGHTENDTRAPFLALDEEDTGKNRSGGGRRC